MRSIALVVPLLWATCSAIPTKSSTLFDYETHYLTDDQSASPVSIKNNTCKVFPGDAEWPSAQDWDRLNQTLNGALIQTVPIAAVCYPELPQYNQERCDYVTNRWDNSTLHAPDPASIMWPIYQGTSCLPNIPGKSTSCTLGGYPNYVINASTVEHIQLGVKFARENGLRLVIKNSGHDYLGKSNGAGSLSIWTHRLNDIQYFEDYQSTRYRGAAIKMGAGLDAEKLYTTAKRVGFTPVSVGGEGHTVGVAGGYILGGGHSPMSSKHGLSVDQILSMQVVLANGTFVTVTEETDSDLFWALRGSGGSTYGVVTSVTSAVYPPTEVTLCTFNLTTGPNVTVDTFWKGFRYYLDYFPEHAEAGIYSYFTLIVEDDKFIFHMNPFFAPGLSPAEVQDLLQPWFTQLDHLGIELQNFVLRPYDNIFNAWTESVVRQPVGGVNRAAGSRFFPRSNWDSKDSLDATANALRETVTNGHRIVAYNMKFDPPKFTAPNAANPAFRSAFMFAITTTVWDPLTLSPKQILAQIQDFAGRILDGWRRVSPGSGAYLSEAVVLEPDFQSSFFGAGPDHYDRLLALKERYDPDDVFYAFRAVGSEKWELHSETTPGFPDQNGRLCRNQ